jgi:methylmalonyl-CoA mutase N-terminal domain/subunit
MEKESVETLNQIDAKGEWWDSDVQNWISQQMATASYRFQKEVEKGERVVIGVNKRIEDDKDNYTLPLWREDRHFVEKQIASLNRVRRERDPQHKDRAAENLFDACFTGENIVTPTIEAVKAYMTIGEIYEVYEKATKKS